MTVQTVDRDALLFRIRRTVQNLEKAPAEDQRPVFANLIKFAELHPTKVRLGSMPPPSLWRLPVLLIFVRVRLLY